jgi:spore germination cell wall hydrolase CwlJ-like protein
VTETKSLISRGAKQLVLGGSAILLVGGGIAWLKPAAQGSITAPPLRSLPAHPPIIGAASTGPKEFKPLSPEEAVKENVSIPIAKLASPGAQPFRLVSANPQDYSRALECLSQAIYFEARGESSDGERAVAQVVLNRVRHPAFPKTVCGVVFEGENRATGCQFTFTCQRADLEATDARERQEALRIAARALSGDVYRPIGLSTHYHADWVVPYWAATLVKTAVVGRHIFYRWAGWADPRFFRATYRGNEPDTLKAEVSGTVDPTGLDLASELILRPPITVGPVEPPTASDRVKSRVAADRVAPKLLADQGGHIFGDAPNHGSVQSTRSTNAEMPLPACGPTGTIAALRATAVGSSATPAGAAQPICH